MRQILYIGLLTMCLASCTRYQMPPFSTSGGGTTQGNSLINENAKLEQDFTKSDEVLLPLKNGGDESKDQPVIGAKARENDNEPSYSDYILQADECYSRGDFAGASAAFEKAFATGSDVPGSHLYNAACVAALAGQPDVAFQRLNRRLAQDTNWYVSDPYCDSDLASLHTDPRWQTYCDTIAARRERIEVNYDKPLRQQLQKIAQSDQDVRYAFLSAMNTAPRDQQVVDSLLREMVRIDSINQVAICDILDTRGFVGKDKVGDACGAFWTIIQHAPLELQRKYFPTFVEAMKRGDLPKLQIAMMDDRIAMFENRPQKYGTQIITDDDGKRKLHTLLDPSMVDQWRQEMDLPPLADYLKSMGVEP